MQCFYFRKNVFRTGLKLSVCSYGLVKVQTALLILKSDTTRPDFFTSGKTVRGDQSTEEAGLDNLGKGKNAFPLSRSLTEKLEHTKKFDNFTTSSDKRITIHHLAPTVQQLSSMLGQAERPERPL